MIEKEKLLAKLKGQINNDERLISIYSDHIRNSMVHSPLRKEVVAEISSMLQKRKELSAVHAITRKKLVELIVNSDRDVY